MRTAWSPVPVPVSHPACQTTHIGHHVFYRFPSGSERPIYQQALARRLGSSAARRATEELIPPADEAADDAAATGADTTAPATPTASTDTTAAAASDVAT